MNPQPASKLETELAVALRREVEIVNQIRDEWQKAALAANEVESQLRWQLTEAQSQLRAFSETYATIREIFKDDNPALPLLSLVCDRANTLAASQAREKVLRDALTQIFQWWDMNDGHLITNYPIPVALGMASIRVALAQPTPTPIMDCNNTDRRDHNNGAQ